MIGKIYKELLILILVFGVIWAIFSYLKLEPETPEMEFSVSQEEQLAEVITESILAEYDEVHIPYVDSNLHQITSRLENAIDSTPYEYHFHVIETPVVNAFATVGGHIFIHTGLIKEMGSAEEFAAVIAHEMGHVEHRHVVNKLVKEIGITLLFSILTGNDPVIVGEIMQSLLSSAFDRSQEHQADQYGLILLEKAHIQPRAMAHAFRKLKNQSNGLYVPEIISTHPNINARIKAAVNYDTDEAFEAQPFSIDWSQMQDTISVYL